MSINPLGGLSYPDPTVDVTANASNRSVGVGVDYNIGNAGTVGGEVGRTHDGGVALGYNLTFMPSRLIAPNSAVAPFVGARLHGAVGGGHGDDLAAGARAGVDYTAGNFRAGAFVGIDAALAGAGAKPSGPEVGAYVGFHF
jgi:hypothetical protein